MADTFTNATAMIGADTTVVQDETKLTADQSADATAHSVVVDDLKAGGPFVIVGTDPLASQIFTLSPDGTAVVITPVRVAVPPAPPAA